MPGGAHGAEEPARLAQLRIVVPEAAEFHSNQRFVGHGTRVAYQSEGGVEIGEDGIGRSSGGPPDVRSGQPGDSLRYPGFLPGGEGDRLLDGRRGMSA